MCQCVHERALLWLVLLSVICTHQVSEAPAGFCSGRCADNGRTHGASRRNDAAERWVSIGGEPSRFNITIGSMRSTQTKSVRETESNTVITLLLQRSNASVRISHIYEVYSTDKPSETPDALNWTRVTSLTSVRLHQIQCFSLAAFISNDKLKVLVKSCLGRNCSKPLGANASVVGYYGKGRYLWILII